MTITDNERREVARRLREIRPCKSGHIKWWEIAKALGLKQPAGWFGWEKFEPDSVNRLADLIEPSYDRDALMTLANECDIPGCGLYHQEQRRIARRIRKALGVCDG